MRLPATVFTLGLWLLALTNVQASFMDDTKDLQGKVVVSAGDFEELTCPVGGKYDCTTWPNSLLRTPDYSSCIASDSFVSCSFRCKGIVATDQSRNLYFYAFSSGVGSVDLKKHRVTAINCPTMY